MLLIWYPLSLFASNTELLIVDVQWLKQHKEDQDLAIVDVRSREQYLKGHIPNAVNIPVSSTFNPKTKRDRVANSFYIQSLFSQAGINNNDTVVLYDSGNHIDGGRVFWVFEVFGHKNVKLLNGGFPSWVDNSSNATEIGFTQVAKSNYIPRLEPERLTTKLGIQLAIGDDDRIIIDARSQDEYNGKQSIASRMGHIPSAINIPWNDNFTNGEKYNKLKSKEELLKVYGSIDPNKKIYLYCNKGKQSSLSYMVMRQLGFDAAHYDGSWYEWGNDELLPIEQKQTK